MPFRDVGAETLPLCHYPYSSGFTSQAQELAELDVSKQALRWMWRQGSFFSQNGGVTLSVKASYVETFAFFLKSKRPRAEKSRIP